jgi:SPX domain protein involved in polyphosphate accumulation
MERKFPIEPRSIDILGAWLGHACRPAPEYPSGQVTSCYYDTSDWERYLESLDGDFEKCKVRLRWYDELPAAGPVTAYLEAKEKAGGITWKRRTPLTLDAELLRQSRFEQALPPVQLEAALAGMGIIDQERLRPAVAITYRRQRFVEQVSDMHLAMDSEIEVWPANAALRARRTRFPAAVLEIKGTELDLPPWFRPLRKWVTVWSSHSKYAMAVEMLRRELRPNGL